MNVILGIGFIFASSIDVYLTFEYVVVRGLLIEVNPLVHWMGWPLALGLKVFVTGMVAIISGRAREPFSSKLLIILNIIMWIVVINGLVMIKYFCDGC